MDTQFDEGFASSSSIEDAQTKDIIRRRRAQSLHRKKPSLAASQFSTNFVQTFPVDTLKMAPIERILWLISFLWSIYQLTKVSEISLKNKALLVWTVIILIGLSMCHTFSRTRKSKSNNTVSEKSTTDSSDDSSTLSPTTSTSMKEETPTSPNSSNIAHQYRKNKINDVPSSSVIFPTNRIFGASRAAFRADADDGLLCGVLLMPMVGCAQLINTITKYKADPLQIELTQAKLELILLMSLIFIILVTVSNFSQPVKRIIRKRGLFVSSILVSGVFTFLITRLTYLTPTLGKTPIFMTFFSVTTFQWSLYLCVVALKRCFTLGEMCVISESAAVVIHKALELVFATFFSNRVPNYINVEEIDDITVLILSVVIGIIFIGIVSYPLLRQSRLLAQKPYWRSSTSTDTIADIQRRKIIFSISFYCLSGAIVMLLISPLCHTLIKKNPFLWVLDFLFSSPIRLFLCMYWMVAIGITVIIWVLMLDIPVNDEQQQQAFFNTPSHIKTKKLTNALNKRRKLFHGLAVVMFVPGVLFARSFLQLAFGVALGAFIYLEYLRYFALWPYGKNLHTFLTEFIDNRDLGPVILSHIYLLVGCAVPVWLGSSNILASLTGILALGFGDSAASLVGKRFGKYKWPGTKKTVEGTIAFILTVFISSIVIMYASSLLRVNDVATFIESAGRHEWLKYFYVVTMTGLLEAFSSQNDNIIIPFYMYALVVLCQLSN